MTITKEGYVCRLGGKNLNRQRTYYDWFPVRCTKTDVGIVQLGQLRLPTSLIGRKIKFKIEVIPDEDEQPTNNLKPINNIIDNSRNHTSD